MLLQAIVGVALAFLGCVLPRLNMVALVVAASWSIPAGISCYMAGLIFSTWRQLIRPETSADPEVLSLRGKNLLFENDRDAQIIGVASLKLMCLVSGLGIGLTVTNMGLDRVYLIAPFVLIPVVWLTLRKLPQKEVAKSIAFLALFLGVLASLGSIIPAIRPVLYMSLACQLPIEEVEVKANATYEIKKLGASSHSVMFWGVMSGMMPGLNPGTIINAMSFGVDPRIACVAMNATGEGVALGIFTFGRPTGRTVLTEQISRFMGELLPTDVLIPLGFGTLVSIAFIPVFVRALDDVMPNAQYRDKS